MKFVIKISKKLLQLGASKMLFNFYELFPFANLDIENF